MRNKILQLLESTVYEDVLIGIELSYELSIQEFEELYTYKKLNCNMESIHRFAREYTDFHITRQGTVLRYGTPDYIFTKRELIKRKYPGWINLGYKPT